MMQVQYSPEDDILYIKFRKAREVACIEVTESIYIDLDSDDRLAGIEIQNASHQVGRDNWTAIDFAGLTASPKKKSRATPTAGVGV